MRAVVVERAGAGVRECCGGARVFADSLVLARLREASVDLVFAVGAFKVVKT